MPNCVVPQELPLVLHAFQNEVPHTHVEVHGALNDLVPRQDPEPHGLLLADVKVFPSHCSPELTTPLPHSATHVDPEQAPANPVDVVHDVPAALFLVLVTV